MIRIVLLGRTGNHLFQYALGRVLAERHGVPLVLDASWFNREGWAEVSHFLKLPLKARVVRRFSIATRALRNFTGKHYWEFRGVPVLKELVDDQSFDERFVNAPADCMLFGYFQTPRFFENLAEELRVELNEMIWLGARAPSVQASASCGGSVEAQLSQPNSVAVHVRRGDYLKHPALDVCDMPYYREAMRRMRARIADARFYIFSDDPDWCHAQFNGSDHLVIDSGPVGRDPLHDLRLMSLASHHIIANSTYSWWAAWLGNKAGQQVIMPDRWYNRDIVAPIEEKRGGAHWEIL